MIAELSVCYFRGVQPPPRQLTLCSLRLQMESRRSGSASTPARSPQW